MANKWTRDEKESLKKLFYEGKTNYELSQTLGRSLNAITSAIYTLGLKRKICSEYKVKHQHKVTLLEMDEITTRLRNEIRLYTIGQDSSTVFDYLLSIVDELREKIRDEIRKADSKK